MKTIEEPKDMSALPAYGYRITSPCGRVFEVPMVKVRDDYVQFLIDNDGVSREEALKQMTPGTVSTWFYEQFAWSDVDREGVCVQQASTADIQAALDSMRRGSNPSDTATLQQIPKEVAKLNAKHLDAGLPEDVRVVAPGAKPRM